MVVLHRAGVSHSNADSFSRQPDGLPCCSCYSAGKILEELPCHGCAFCSRAQEHWERFKLDIDDVVPLSVRQVLPIQTNPPETDQNNGDDETSKNPALVRGMFEKGGNKRLPWVMLRARLWESRKLPLLKSEPAATAVFHSTFRILLWTYNICAVSNYLSEFDRVVVSNGKCTKSVSALLHWKTLFTLGKHAGYIDQFPG